MKFALFLLLTLTAAAAHAARPNVLFLFADDMRADSIGALGNPVVKTPNLDTLVKSGMAFDNACCFGGNSPAVCTPSRNMLLSGKAYFRWKDHLSPMAGKKQAGALCPGEGLNFPASMKEAGYLTYHHGKKGNTALEIQARFELNKYLQNDQAERNSGEPGKEIADGAVEFVKGRKEGDRPFFMYLAFGNPHDPRVAAPKYLEQYQRDQIPLPVNYLPQHPFDNGEMTVRDEALSPWPRTEAEIRKTLHEYYAVITAMDSHIGRILAALKESGQYDNTIILFSADQGIAVGSHGLLGKQNLYNAGMNSPLIFTGPGIKQGRTDAMVYLLDIYPTVCALTGAPVREGIDGISFKPVLDGVATAARKEMFFAYRHLQRAYRDEQYKIIRYPEINKTQLFDVAADRYETKDLAGDPAQAGRITGMMAKLEKAQAFYTDTLPLTSANPKPAAWVAPK